jgi:CDP-paratose 2-epimerase
MKQAHTSRNGAREAEYILITGGAGFIGSNLSHRLMEQGERVMIFDSLARPGVERNLRWLQEQHGELMQVQIADIRDRASVDHALRRANAVYHFAAQVAVTTSIANPVEDFEINTHGTLNLLEAMRSQGKQIPLLFTSSNKVYGDLSDISLQENVTRYQPADEGMRSKGVGEGRPLAFHSPYGCSKGAADQYILDYAHTFGLPATVFRMSCIYGPRQFGTEDQGWVAHFLIRALRDQPITIYGDGKQVRDILFIDDLVRALQLAHAYIERTAGQAFNIGGGPSNTISLIELLDFLQMIQGTPVNYSFDEWRRGDQRYYVSDTHKFQETTGWSAQVPMQKGLARLYEWLRSVEPEVEIKPNSPTRPTLKRELVMTEQERAGARTDVP